MESSPQFPGTHWETVVIVGLTANIHVGETLLSVRLVYLFWQVKEASAALQKTTQQVQKLAQMVSKPPGAPLLRPPPQSPSQSGEHTCFNLRVSYV